MKHYGVNQIRVIELSRCAPRGNNKENEKRTRVYPTLNVNEGVNIYRKGIERWFDKVTESQKGPVNIFD